MNKIGGIVLAIVLVGVAIGIAIWRTGPSSEARATRDKAEATALQVVDADSLEMVPMTAGEWSRMTKVDPRTGYKIGKGGRKLAEAHTCASCRAQIPPYPAPQTPGPRFDEYRKQVYMCPKCGKPACPEGLRPEAQKLKLPPEMQKKFDEMSR